MSNSLLKLIDQKASEPKSVTEDLPQGSGSTHTIAPVNATTAPGAAFSLMKNVLDKPEVTSTDVSNYLDAAHEANDEVESVAFGLETDDGQIVKVYVAKVDADEFENAMAKKLGEEDNIENAINELAKDFDIVHVDWPNAEGVDDNAEPESSESEDSTLDLELPELTVGDESDVPVEEPVDDAADDAAEDDEVIKLESEIADAEAELEKLKAEDTVDEEAVKELETKIKDLEAKLEALNKNTTDKSEDKKMEQTVGQKFKARVLKESAADIMPSKEEALLDMMVSNNAKLLMQAILLLNMPADLLSLKKAQVRTSVRAKALDVAKNAGLRVWLNKLVGELSRNSTKETEKAASDLEDSKVSEAVAMATVEDALVNKMQIMIYNILLGLGVPESIMNARKTQVRRILRNTALDLNKNSRARTYLKNLAKVMGLTLDDKEKETKKGEEVTEEIEISEALPKFRPGNIVKLKTAGLKTRDKTATVKSVPLMYSDRGEGKSMVMLDKPIGGFQFFDEDDLVMAEETENTGSLAEAIAKRRGRPPKFVNPEAKKEAGDVISGDADDEDQVDADVKASEAPIKRAKKNEILAADLGMWSIAKLGSSGGVTLAVKNFTVKIPESEVEKLIDTFAEAGAINVKGVSGRYGFKPLKRGLMYSVKKIGDTKYPDGVIMPKETIDALIDFLSGN